jgi:hypothetical protein
MNQRQGANILTTTRALPPLEVRAVVERIVTVQENLQLVLAGLTKLASGTDEEVRRMVSAVEELGRVQKTLCELHHQTDDKLNALIAVVDDLVRVRKAGA